MDTYTIALVGNPNVGKSTLFNALTGLHQHTGNWSGKTIDSAVGSYIYQNTKFKIIDLPGTYSLASSSSDEQVTAEYLYSGEADVVITILSASSLERTLYLTLQIIDTNANCIIGLNMIDEAEKNHIHIDIQRLSAELKTPVIKLSARSQQGIASLKEAIYQASVHNPHYQLASPALADTDLAAYHRKASRLKKQTQQSSSCHINGHWLDTLCTSGFFAYPLMLCLLSLIFYLTIEGANLPSAILSEFFSAGSIHLTALLHQFPTPAWLTAFLINGIYQSTAWVISVMLPPMAIFFPLFTLLEDFGYLPRIAFNLDCLFKKCHACGKQALTMCMGFGCNAAGVMACRIIDSPREKLIAILTNSLVPCNGRFPLYIVLAAVFFAPLYAERPYSTFIPTLVITFLVLLGILTTFIASFVLSRTLLRGQPSTNILELPPFRRPHFSGVIYRSIISRTIFVLRRAVIMAAPAGAIIWLLGNVSYNGGSLLSYAAELLNPPAYYLGLDGAILLAFLLGFPANEIVLPILLMIYLSTGQLTDFQSLSSLSDILTANGWTALTAVCCILFSLFHWPCSTTLLTIYKETASLKWTLTALLLPLLCGSILCALTAWITRSFFG